MEENLKKKYLEKISLDAYTEYLDSKKQNLVVFESVLGFVKDSYM